MDEDESTTDCERSSRLRDSGNCSCIMDLPQDSTPRLANQHSFKTSYRLTREEINHPSLNLEAKNAVYVDHPNTRYRQRNIPHSIETIDRTSLPSTPANEQWTISNIENKGDTSSAYRQAQNIQHSRESVNRRNLPGPQSEQVIDPRSVLLFTPVSRFVRWVNHDPFFHFDQLFQSISFPVHRGFDEDGFFFFSTNRTDPQNEEKKAQEATKKQIERAVSQLTGLGTDLEIKKGDSCPICLEQFKTTDDVVEMPCPCKRTFFHRQCAIKTLEMTRKIKCPNCRKWDGKS